MTNTINHFDSGVWQVITKDAFYLLDLNNYFLSKAESEDDINYSAPRTWYKLVEAYATVGANLNLAIKWRHDLYAQPHTAGTIIALNKLA